MGLLIVSVLSGESEMCICLSHCHCFLRREIIFLPLIVASEEDTVLDKEALSASHFFLPHFFPLGEDLAMPPT